MEPIEETVRRLEAENRELRKHNRALMERQHHNDMVGDCRNPPPMQADNVAACESAGGFLVRQAKRLHAEADELTALARLVDGLDEGPAKAALMRLATKK